MTRVLLSANTDWYLYHFRLSLLHYLRECGFEVVLVTPTGRYAPLLIEQGFTWIPWEVGRQTFAPWVELPALLKLAHIYRQAGAELAHHHTIKPVLYGSLVAHRLGLDNVVNSITGRGYVFLSKGSKARSMRFFIKYFYRLALSPLNYAAIFENETDRQYFIQQKIVLPQCTWLIPGVGVDPHIFQPAPEPQGNPLVLLPGRLLWDKGIGTLVEAARLLKKTASARIVLVGEPDPGNPASIETSLLEEWVREGVIEWWGWQSDMNGIYAQCHIVAAPTMYGEGLPTILLEAAACGRPVVTTNMPGCREVVEDGQNGLLVPPNDPPALAGALQRLIASPALRGKMGAIGRQLVLQKFTTSHINTATLDVYRTLLNPKNPF